jgi:hypothetical protein
MGGAGAGFAASASEEDTRYGLSLDAKEFVDGATYRQYYWKGDYPKLETRDSAVSVSNPGRRDPDGYKEPFRSNLFSITAKVKAKP